MGWRMELTQVYDSPSNNLFMISQMPTLANGQCIRPYGRVDDIGA